MGSLKKDRAKRQQKKSLAKDAKRAKTLRKRRQLPLKMVPSEQTKSKTTIQRLVRQRERFFCALCRSKAGEQYAHIVPDADKGDYSLENVIFLCYEHHNHWLEAAKTKGSLYEQLLKTARAVRDQPKADGVLNALFAWSQGDQLAISLGGGIRFTNQERILESKYHPKRPYLSLSVNTLGILEITAYFEDENGKFMSIVKNRLEVDTTMAWDIVFERRRFSLIHHEKKINLQISQMDNLDLFITGRLYLNGGYFEIAQNAITDLSHHNVFTAFQASYNGMGALFTPGTFML